MSSGYERPINWNLSGKTRDSARAETLEAENADLRAHVKTLRNAIETVCEGWTLPEGARKTLEKALWPAIASEKENGE